MAQKVQVVLVDDVDGGSADETVAFALDGVTYEIDLTKKNAARLRDAFAPWVGAARKASGPRGRRGAAGVAPAAVATSARSAPGRRSQGIAVSERGRISAERARAVRGRALTERALTSRPVDSRRPRSSCGSGGRTWTPTATSTTRSTSTTSRRPATGSSRTLFGTEAYDFVLAHVEIDYRREITQAAGEVTVESRVTGWGRSSVRTAETIRFADGTVSAEGAAVVVARDAASGASRPLTDAELTLLTPLAPRPPQRGSSPGIEHGRITPLRGARLVQDPSGWVWRVQKCSARASGWKAGLDPTTPLIVTVAAWMPSGPTSSARANDVAAQRGLLHAERRSGRPGLQPHAAAGEQQGPATGRPHGRQHVLGSGHCGHGPECQTAGDVGGRASRWAAPGCPTRG